jgi:hypothetical protein
MLDMLPQPYLAQLEQGREQILSSAKQTSQLRVAEKKPLDRASRRKSNA